MDQMAPPNSTLVGLDTPCDSTDRDLFNASTVITVGKGDKVSCWHSNWVNGHAPKYILHLTFSKKQKGKI
jgi:hypothetical protein